MRSEVYDKLFNLLFEVIGNRNDKDEFNKVMIDILSPVERIMIAKRIVIMYLIIKEINYKTICDVVKVSNATVSKFRLTMEKSDGIVPLLKEMIKIEKVKLFFEELLDSLAGPGVVGVSWSSAWKRRNDLERKKQLGI